MVTKGNVEVVATVEGTFGPSESTEGLLLEAMAVARRRADLLAAAAGGSLGAIVSIRESGDRRLSTGPYPLTGVSVRADGFHGGGESVELPIPETRISITVTVVFSLESPVRGA